MNRLANTVIAECAATTPERDRAPLYVPPGSHFGMASSAPQFDVEPITILAQTVDAILRQN